jgi:putative endonuclease
VNHYVYILTNNSKVDTMLHVGMPKDILKTVEFYRQLPTLFFNTDQYVTNLLVYLEQYTANQEAATTRFKEIMLMSKDQKHELINSINPQWLDLTHMLK